MMSISLGQAAKEDLVALAKEVDKRLEKRWKSELSRNFGFDPEQKKLSKIILKHAQEHCLRSAKRIRAAFVYYGYLLGNKSVDEEVWKAMEAMELVQTALLMHDDFMDEDKLRRGLPTTQVFFGAEDAHYGDSMAVDIGDLVLCLGYERILECNLDKSRVLEASKLLMRGIAETALGQAYDVSLPRLGDLNEDKVLSVHKTKTAIYTFQNPLLIGVVLAGLGDEVRECLKKYSQKAGVAFQLRDDILGMFGESKKTGKSTDSDLLQGKSTLLVAKTWELGDKRQQDDLRMAWGNKKASKKQIKEAKKAIVDSGSYDYSMTISKRLIEEVVAETNKLEKMGLNMKAINFLRGIAEYIVERDL